mmetsp:Transcript_21419/g.15337  ORF Transcript_21419/g.15337 Transcript_21419/m.15337 type:complete len:135 (+) Transcript_21419:115-519(+)
MLVTLGSSVRNFCLGIDSKISASIAKDKTFDLMISLTDIYKRLMQLGMPTLCILSGNCSAEGLLFALCHDKRVMRDDYGFTSMSTISESKSAESEFIMTKVMPTSFYTLIRDCLPVATARIMVYGKSYSSRDSL